MTEIMGQVTTTSVIKVICDICGKQIYYSDPKAVLYYDNPEEDYDDHPNKDFCKKCYREMITYIEVLEKLSKRIANA